MLAHYAPIQIPFKTLDKLSIKNIKFNKKIKDLTQKRRPFILLV